MFPAPAPPCPADLDPFPPPPRTVGRGGFPAPPHRFLALPLPALPAPPREKIASPSIPGVHINVCVRFLSIIWGITYCRWTVCYGWDEDRDDKTPLQVLHRGQRDRDQDGLQTWRSCPLELRPTPRRCSPQNFQHTTRGIKFEDKMCQNYNLLAIWLHTAENHKTLWMALGASNQILLIVRETE